MKLTTYLAIPLCLAFLAAAGCKRKAEQPAAESGAGGQPSGAETKPEEEAGEAVTTAQAVPADALPPGTTLKGTVKFEGKAPEMAEINMSQKPECVMHSKDVFGGQPVREESVVVNPNGTLRDVLVYVKKGVKGRYLPPKEPAVVDQRGCVYHPHVFKIMVRQDLKILNNDPFNHNVKVPAINLNLGFTANDKEVLKKRPFLREMIPAVFQCDIHPWMRAYACVLSHPFGDVTGEDGSFEIQNLPPGKYTVGVWHEDYPGLEAPPDQEIEIKEGEATKELTFTFKYSE